MIHYIWPFLDVADRVSASQAHHVWSLYPILRLTAVQRSIAFLRSPRPPPGRPTHLCPDRAILNGCALLRFHFVYGDFQRWLSGEYTNRHRDWQGIFHQILALPLSAPPVDLPSPDLPRAFRINTEGVPLVANYTSSFQEVHLRDCYNNHPAVAAQSDTVEQKFAGEEEKSFHLHFPRFLLHFISGLLLNPLQWVVRKGKGRICVDCTNGPNPDGSPNSFNS
jgi:hypothetical protein